MLKRRYNVYHGHDEFEDLPRAGPFNLKSFLREVFQVEKEPQGANLSQQSLRERESGAGNSFHGVGFPAESGKKSVLDSKRTFAPETGKHV